MQVEDVTRVGLAARRAAQQQGDGTVCLGLLRQVVVDDQDVLVVVHPVLPKGGTGEGGEPLEARGIGGRSGDDRRVLQSAVLLEGLPDSGDRGTLLADGDVDAADLLLLVAGLPVRLLVEDGVQADRGLAGLTVADDQLTLTATDRGHRVDGLDTGLEGLFDGLTLQHRGRLKLEDAVLFSFDGTHAVDGLTQGVDHAAEELVTDRDGQDFSRPLNFVALFETLVVAQDHHADAVGVEVLCDADDAARELEQLIRHH